VILTLANHHPSLGSIKWRACTHWHRMRCVLCCVPPAVSLADGRAVWQFKALPSDLCRYVDSVANASSVTSAALDAMANSTSTSSAPAEHGAAMLQSANEGAGGDAAAAAPELFYTDPRVRAGYKLWVSGIILRPYCSRHATCTHACLAWALRRPAVSQCPERSPCHSAHATYRCRPSRSA
jgi:hypothetical protein